MSQNPGSQRPDQQPAAEKAGSGQPRQSELSKEQLDRVSGGISDISVTKQTDKASPKL